MEYCLGSLTKRLQIAYTRNSSANRPQSRTRIQLHQISRPHDQRCHPPSNLHCVAVPPILHWRTEFKAVTQEGFHAANQKMESSVKKRER